LPTKGADDKLLRVLEAACRRVLGPMPEVQDLVHEVRRFIIERLPKASATADAVATA